MEFSKADFRAASAAAATGRAVGTIGSPAPFLKEGTAGTATGRPAGKAPPKRGETRGRHETCRAETSAARTRAQSGPADSAVSRSESSTAPVFLIMS